MRPLLVCAFLCFGMPASAQSLFFGDRSITVSRLVECAVILDRVEVEPGNAPEFAGREVDFPEIAEGLRHVAASHHGERLVEDLTASHEAAWDDVPVTLRNRVRAASVLDECWPFIAGWL